VDVVVQGIAPVGWGVGQGGHRGPGHHTHVMGGATIGCCHVAPIGWEGEAVHACIGVGCRTRWMETMVGSRASHLSDGRWAWWV
jgi:hypothetical protein